MAANLSSGNPACQALCGCLPLSFSNEVAFPGYTWGIHPAEQRMADRIGFIYLQGTGWETMHSELLGPDDFPALGGAYRFPSDHRPVVSHLFWQEAI